MILIFLKVSVIKKMQEEGFEPMITGMIYAERLRLI